MHDHTQLVRHIEGVRTYREHLSKLSERWDLLTLLGHMSNIGMDMSATKEAFWNLTDELMRQLIEESVRKNVASFSSIAKVAVDILIRNLFERTTDIGFLATDDEIRAYIAFLKNERFESDAKREERRIRKELLTLRFKDYVSKYSVYDDIVLLDTQGAVLARLSSEYTINNSKDPIITEALHTGAEYVEAYRYSDLFPQTPKSLLYAYKVKASSDDDAPVLGVLCLRFRFEDEMRGIFENLKKSGDAFEITLLDEQGCVIASSDPYHIPVGVCVSMELQRSFALMRLHGREYVVKTCATGGYQGYYGPGWFGHVMAPVEYAFESQSTQALTVEPQILRALTLSSTLFPKALATIPKQAEKIQHELNTTVWNGNVKIANTKSGDNTFSKSLLHEISLTGSATKEIFESSIAELNATVVGSLLENVRFQAALAIDIMDRNLYERANDCRWWALTTYFRSQLALEPQARDVEAISAILSHINALYTVYANLVLFDASGTVVACSNDERWVSQTLQAPWVRQTLSITQPQRYSVSDFAKTPLYEGRHTYIYCAPVLSLDAQKSTVGGIAIVFDAEPQFSAMLRDALPAGSEGKSVEGSFGLFCDRSRNVIACSDARVRSGDVIALDERFFTPQSGSGHSAAVAYEGQYYVVGSASCHGYREYKTSDGYRNDVIALIFIPVAKVLTHEAPIAAIQREYAYPRAQNDEEAVDISTFYINGKLYGMNSRDIVCSLTNQEITKILGSSDIYLGIVSFEGRTLPVVSLRKLINGSEGYDPASDTIIVAQSTRGRLGLVVDRVFDSPSIPKRSIESSAGMGLKLITTAIVKPDNGDTRKELLSLLDVEAIADRVFKVHEKSA
ncbi:MAG: chemotaxis protein CheW [Campylobacterales bacterium]|nr:chemotaxis protein CheW [Campylobacterales bacterium]